VKTLISDENRVLAKLEAAVDVNSTPVKEVEDLGDDEGVSEAQTNEGGVTEESGADRRTVRILNIP
jgi:hypothetical protein